MMARAEPPIVEAMFGLVELRTRLAHAGALKERLYLRLALLHGSLLHGAHCAFCWAAEMSPVTRRPMASLSPKQ